MNGTEVPRVVVCGSMTNLGLMNDIAVPLREAGIEAVTPEADDRIAGSATAKRAAALRHMGHIRHPRTTAILVVNVDRPGEADYVGPSAFAEIAVAFADARRVFLLQGMPGRYADELSVWGVECLDGDWPRLPRALGARRVARPEGRRPGS